MCVLITLLLFFLSVSGCAFENTPKRLMAYLPPPSAQAQSVSTTKEELPAHEVTGALVVLNDTSFEKSAPELRKGTLQHLGEQLKTELEKHLPIRVSSLVFPEGMSPEDSSEMFAHVAEEEGVPYLLIAVLSSTEREAFSRLPLGGFQQSGGMRSVGLPGYRAENFSRLELAVWNAQTGQPVVMTDGQATATLERLAVPMESNVYPVVRRTQTQPPIFPDSEGEAFETLRWVSGKDAIAQAVMHLEEVWRKKKPS